MIFHAMQCDFCESKASVFFTQIIDGQSKKSKLCEKCAFEQGLLQGEEHFEKTSHEAQPKQTDTPYSFLENVASSVQNISSEDLSTRSCSQCGFTLLDLKKTGRLGCSECYKVFQDNIIPNLPNMHKGVIHHGYLPEKQVEIQKLLELKEKYQTELQEAIHAEDFEKAALLRDRLKQIE